MSNTYYLPTTSVFVFPSTRRMNKQVSARLVSEASLANIVNKLIETDGFVITPEPEQPETGDPDYNIKKKYYEQGFIPSEPFEFNVYGYYFRATSANSIINLFSGETNFTSIYANIYLDKTTDPNYIELKGQDEVTSGSNSLEVYKGLTFSTDNLSKALSNPADYSLLLFQLENLDSGGSDWVVPIDSRIKFIYTFALGVDGGEIMSGDVSYDL